jgi:hypothetical protein
LARDPHKRKPGSPEQRQPRLELVLYSLRWLLAAAFVAGGAILLLNAIDGGNGTRRPPGASAPAAPAPAQRTFVLEQAASRARCSLRRLPRESAAHRGGPARYATDPPASGPRSSAAPVADGEYGEPPPAEGLVELLRRGGIVISFRPEVSATVRAQLREVFAASPREVVLTPNRTMRPRVAVTAWRRLLACPSPDDRIFDAIRTFRQRYRRAGRGP